jgi:tyrosyl-tRNA synthetase
MEEVKRLGAFKDAQINEAKKILAYEVTKLVHGEEEAGKARDAAEALFGGKRDSDNIPGIEILKNEIEGGIKLLDIIVTTGLTPSKSEARRAVQQGGIYINDNKISDMEYVVNEKDVLDGQIILQRGKKNFCRVKLK